MKEFFWEYIFELNFLALCISVCALLNISVKQENFWKHQLLRGYLFSVTLLTSVSFITEFALNHSVSPLVKMHWVCAHEYCNQIFTSFEFFVFANVLFLKKLNKRSILLLAVSFWLGATALYILCLAGVVKWETQIKAGELFAIVELLIFSILILLKISFLYGKDAVIDYHNLILLLAFLGYSVISAPSFIMANYLSSYSYDYVNLFYDIHRCLWVILCLAIWYCLRGGFKRLNLLYQ